MKVYKLIKSQTGFTLLEVLVGAVIGVILLLISYSFIQVGARGYKRGAEAVSESRGARTAFDIIKQDLDRMCPDLPLCLGVGATDTGYTFVNGAVVDWDVGYGTRLPSESQIGFPNDRIGFFTVVPESKANRYGGLRIAHVLYFTALTKDVDPENLTQSNNDNERGYSRKLFRHFTPPDRVYARLKLLDPTIGKGDLALPRGPSYSPLRVVADDSDWGLDAEAAVVSLVTTGVTQFSIELQGNQEVGSSYNMSVMTSGLVDYLSSLSVHDLLSMDHSEEPSISPRKAKVILRLCPYEVEKTLSVEEWNRRVGESYFGREGNVPDEFSFFHHF